MLKKDFVREIAKKSALSIETVATVVGFMEDEILDVISKEDYVRLAFGTIGGKTTNPRKARNPRTGETLQVPAKHGYPWMKFSKSAKETDESAE